MNTLDFRDYVLEQGCLRHGTPAVAHHLDAVGMGRSRKRDIIEHLSLVPLCQEICHIEIHTIGIREFQDRHGINLWRENARLLARWIWNAR